MLTLTHSRLPAAHGRNSSNASRLISDAPQRNYRRPRLDIAPLASPSLSLSLNLRLASQRNFANPGAPRLFSSRAGPSLAGSLPYHNTYVLLHTHAPVSEYPPRSKSPLWRAFTMRGREWGAIVNFAWAPGAWHAVHPAYAALGEPSGKGSWSGWSKDGKKEGEPVGETGEGGEAYVASVFSSAHPTGRFVIPKVTLANLDAVDVRLRALLHGDSGKLEDPRETDVAVEEAMGDGRKLFLYVCTHGSRDCRCGDCGGAVARALRREIDSRGVAREVFLGEVAHVGGHQYVVFFLLCIARQGHGDG